MAGKRPARKVMLRADAVWDRLNRLNMTQNDLARLLGISSGHLSRLINGRRCPLAIDAAASHGCPGLLRV